MSGKKEEELAGAIAAVSLDDDELLATATGGSADDRRFDQIVGAIEDIMMDPTFQGPQEEFCRANCEEFDDTGENKLSYTALFEEYTTLTETALNNKLEEAIEDFKMEEFLRLLEARESQIAGDVFDMLTSFGDFEEFKSLMLSYKAQAAFEAGDTSGTGALGMLLYVAPVAKEDGKGKAAAKGAGGAGAGTA